VPRYTFDEVRAALSKHWGLRLARGGGEGTDGVHDGRWDVAYSRTGFVVDGQFPRRGYSHQRFRSLRGVVSAWDLKKVIEKGRILVALRSV